MPSRTVNLAWDAEYALRSHDSPNKLVILLHGFQQRGQLIYNLLEGAINPDALVLAPNAPFPFPSKKPVGGYEMGYTWYFFDPEKDVYYYDMSLALNYLERLIEDLGYAKMPKSIIGYSQGGYLAPFLGEKLGWVEQVVGINCRFRSEALRAPLPYQLIGIHGEKDVLVDPERARRCHQELIDQGVEGRFHMLPNAGHGISGQVRSLLRELT